MSERAGATRASAISTIKKRASRVSCTPLDTPPAGFDTLLSVLPSGDDGLAKGTVKWFNPTKGYGFIQPDSGGSDVFVHVTAVQKAGLQGLDENAKVEYELENQRGKTSAIDLKVL